MPDGTQKARPTTKPWLDWKEFPGPPPRPARVKQYLIYAIPKDGDAKDGVMFFSTYDPHDGWNRVWYSFLIPVWYAEPPRPPGMGPDPADAPMGALF